ncbi:MAG: DUF4229 domain-containing protein [Nocardioidaceae bacterium]
MKSFVLYTLARVVMFAATWAVVWLVASIWLDWSSLTALWTALVATAISSVASFVLLRGLRDRFAEGVHERAVRTRDRYEAAKRREDDIGG